MRRKLGIAALVALAALAGSGQAVASSGGSGAGEHYGLACDSGKIMCQDPAFNLPGHYIGHDEPSVGFQSNRPGSGNDVTYTVRLPKNPPTLPNQQATGGTWDFMLRPTFWIGMVLCDSQSAPNFTHVCKADSDSNNKISPNPSSPNYIGKHPGNAFMEIQWYSPGYVEQFDGFGCTAHQYCAALTIDSFPANQNTGQGNNADCNNFPLVGEEPVNWAYVTKSGRSQAPANPLSTSRALLAHGESKALNPDPKQDLLMNGGDTIRVHIHDTPAGVQVDMHDLTTGRSGSMTASKQNGFGQILFQPNAAHCHVRPYAFHPMYNTAVPRGNTWAAHANNLAFSDEIGHFEYCDAIDSEGGNCTKPGPGDPKLDSDDVECFDGAASTLVQLTGCFAGAGDFDFDGTSYQRDWPGTLHNRHRDRMLHETPLMISSPLTRGHQYSRVLFETNLPGNESPDVGGVCNTSTGTGCTLPAPGTAFYPIWTTRIVNGACTFQQGGTLMPHQNDFGGSVKTEYGHLLRTVYPNTGFKPQFLFENFRRTLPGNPCPAG
jgi:hypothetical protein